MAAIHQEPKERRFAALQYRDFRLMWFADLIATVVSQLNNFAINWQMVELLKGQSSTFAGITLHDEALQAAGLGMIGLVRFIPIVILSLVSGVLADIYDRRKILMIARSAQGIVLLLLAWLTLTNNLQVTMIYLITALIGALNAFGNPSRQALIPNLVPREALTNALSLNTLMFQIGTILGPALFALLIVNFDLGTIYLGTGIAFVFAVLAIFSLNYRQTEKSKMRFSWEAIADGWRFTFGTRIILSTMLLDFFATFFSSAQTMLPLVVTHVLGLDAAWYGIIGTAQPVGAVLAGSIMAYRREVRRQGMVLLASVFIYGLATAIFGFSTSIALSYVMYALTGAGDTVSTVIRNVIRQLNTPDEMRGRMTSVNMIFFMGGPQLGEFEAGLVAAAMGVPFSIISGGIATVLLTLWLAWAYPELRNYRSDRPISKKTEVEAEEAEAAETATKP
jgi:MFS family permease